MAQTEKQTERKPLSIRNLMKPSSRKSDPSARSAPVYIQATRDGQYEGDEDEVPAIEIKLAQAKQPFLEGYQRQA